MAKRLGPSGGDTDLANSSQAFSHRSGPFNIYQFLFDLLIKPFYTEIEMSKFLLCTLAIILVLSGVLLWKYVSLASIIKSKTPTITDNSTTQYPVSQDIAEKIEKAGLTPLYQLSKDDPEGRTVVYEDADGFEGYRVLNLKQIPDTADYYITVKNIDANVAESEEKHTTFDVRFVGENPPESSRFHQSKIYINKLTNQEELPANTNTALADLIKKDDIVRIEFQGDVKLNTFVADDNGNAVINLVLIQGDRD